MINGSIALTGLTIGFAVSLLAGGLGLLIGYLYWEHREVAKRQEMKRLDLSYRRYPYDKRHR